MKTYKVEWIVTDEIEAVDKEHAEATFWYRLSCNCYDGDLKIEEEPINKDYIEIPKTTKEEIKEFMEFIENIFSHKDEKIEQDGSEGSRNCDFGDADGWY